MRKSEIDIIFFNSERYIYFFSCLLACQCLQHWGEEPVYFHLQIWKLILEINIYFPMECHRLCIVSENVFGFLKSVLETPGCLSIFQLYLWVSLTFTFYHFCLIFVIWEIRAVLFHNTWKILFETSIHFILCTFCFSNQSYHFLKSSHFLLLS